MVLDVYLWESQIQNMKYETNLATCIISKIPNLRNEFDYDCNKSKHRNVTVIWFFFSLILCCLLKHILEAYRFRSFIHTNLQRTYVQWLAFFALALRRHTFWQFVFLLWFIMLMSNHFLLFLCNDHKYFHIGHNISLSLSLKQFNAIWSLLSIHHNINILHNITYVKLQEENTNLVLTLLMNLQTLVPYCTSIIYLN